MANRINITPRDFSADGPLGNELSQLAVTTQEALDAIPLNEYRVFKFIASGTASTELPSVAVSGSPIAVQFMRIKPVLDATGPTGPLTLDYNFYYQSSSVVLFEPDGLTADVEYEATLLVHF